MKIISSLLFLLFISFYSYSQSKLEIEERIKKGEAPPLAQKFIDSLHFSSKIKWFVEQDYDRKTYEAKTKSEGKKYSIEFDTLGKIEDIEVEIKWHQIPIAVRKNICQRLNADFEKHKIKKIQTQYSGSSADLLNLKTSIENLIIKYEIVLKGQKKSQILFYEYLFSKEGEFEEESQFDFRNTDHLEY
ncbi:hypothetical protein WAF17_16030 [Bernardetia sp. ABR2-2B]|uniref:hypothetical protein n=1 Tax=Bernardetia sp. ABR2-2B TaxID=3127472 RepID=UPI0030D1F018